MISTPKYFIAGVVDRFKGKEMSLDASVLGAEQLRCSGVITSVLMPDKSVSIAGSGAAETHGLPAGRLLCGAGG